MVTHHSQSMTWDFDRRAHEELEAAEFPLLSRDNNMATRPLQNVDSNAPQRQWVWDVWNALTYSDPTMAFSNGTSVIPCWWMHKSMSLYSFYQFLASQSWFNLVILCIAKQLRVSTSVTFCGLQSRGQSYSNSKVSSQTGLSVAFLGCKHPPKNSGSVATLVLNGGIWSGLWTPLKCWFFSIYDLHPPEIPESKIDGVPTEKHTFFA